MACPDNRFENIESHARPHQERMLIATSLAGLALALGGLASVHVPSGDQVLQDLVFGMVLGAVYAVTALSIRAFDVRVTGLGFCLLLLVTTILWFVGLKHQFAFASTTAFVVGQGVAAGCAVLLRGSAGWIGVPSAALVGLAIQWLLFTYADPRIVILTGIQGSDSDRLLGSSTVCLAAVVAVVITTRSLARQGMQPATS